MKNKMLAMKNHAAVDVTVISPIPFAPGFLAKRSKRWAEYHGVQKYQNQDGINCYFPRYIRLPGSWFRIFEGLSMFLSVFLILWKIRAQKFSLVLGGNLNDDGLAAYFTGKLLGIKAMSYAIGSDVNTYPYESKAMMKLTHFLLSKLDLVICVGRGLKGHVEKTLGSFPSLTHNYLGVSLESFNYIPQKRNEVMKGLFVGEISDSKGVFDLVKAVRLIPSDKRFELRIVGGGTDSNINTLKILSGDDERIKYLGKIPHSEVSKLFNESDFFIFATYTEGCACVLTEAAASGLPLIISDITQNLDVQGDNAISFQTGNVEEIKQSILKFLSLSSEERERMSKSSRLIAEQNFEEKKAAIDFRLLLEKTLELNL
ncbi:MAG: glycosyltransferase family 4 protein [Bacteriovoracaceae bacterium]